MIPLKLTLRNFMCYRENVPPLSFAGIHTACVSGDNGNGKSALIDAMTWALWGKARSNSDADLIAQGQPEMSVELEFKVGNQPYRVIRRYARPKTRTGAGHTILEFQILTPDGNARSISGNNASQTQQKIIDTLRVDYETFINSAFLRQGHADEFTKQSAGKRKEVLANILRLSHYDELEAMAREQARRWDSTAASVSLALADIQEELKVKAECEAALARGRSELITIEQRLNSCEIACNEFRRQIESLTGKMVQLTQLENHLNQSRQSLVGWENQARQHQGRVLTYAALLSQQTEIESGYAQLLATKRLCDELHRKQSQLMALIDRKNKLEKTIDDARHKLEIDLTVQQKIVADLEQKAAELPRLNVGLQQTVPRLSALEEQEAALAAKRQQSQELREAAARVVTSVVRWEQDVKEIGEKLALLTVHAGMNTAKCPLCEQALGEAEHRRIEGKYRAEQKAKSAALQADQNELSTQRTNVANLDREISLLEKQIKQERSTLQHTTSVLKRDIAEAQTAVDKLEASRADLAALARQFTNREYAQTAQQQLSALTDEIAALDFNQEVYACTQKRLTDLSCYEEPRRQLAEATRSINTEKESLAQATASVHELQQIIVAASQQRELLEKELSALPEINERLARSQNEYRAVAAAQQQAQRAVGQAQEQLRRCAELEAKQTDKASQLNQALEQVKIYQELTQAFGKNGIQALLIETAIPEIEIEADRLLSRMTDNRMHIKMETQRETKKGDVTETLDINVSDELGTRDYDMFSGGEAFRINFAIRIALSRLLANRAGAPLPTLIIDEGFGTQDAGGIEKLKEAIQSIQDDFEIILVVTHVEEMKDAFPTRIEVTRTVEGSTIAVN